MALRPSLTQALIAAGIEAEAMAARGESVLGIIDWCQHGAVLISTDSGDEWGIDVYGMTDAPERKAGR